MKGRLTIETEAHSPVHQVPRVRGANAFLITEGPITLVDTGMPGSGGRILEFMAALGLAPGRLERILLTHRHMDHAGNAAFLRLRTGARVFAHPGDTDAATAHEGHGIENVDCLVEDGQLLEGGIRVVHCGGHTAGSVCYHLEARRVLFLGDMAINNIDRLSRPISFSNEDNAAYEVGLARLVALDAEAGFFGHGPPVSAGLHQALLALQARRRSPLPLAMLRFVWLQARRLRPQ